MAQEEKLVAKAVLEAMVITNQVSGANTGSLARASQPALTGPKVRANRTQHQALGALERVNKPAPEENASTAAGKWTGRRPPA